MVLGLLLALGGLAAVTAQQPPADAPKVIDVEKVRDNLYVFRGGGGKWPSGGRTGAGDAAGKVLREVGTSGVRGASRRHAGRPRQH
jgi:hypothetical protein